MINTFEKDVIIAYFAGGNAKEKSASEITAILDVIKDSVSESKVKREDGVANVFRPGINPAR